MATAAQSDSRKQAEGSSAVLRYRFDLLMARGTSALVGLLAGATLGLVAVAAVILMATGIAPDGVTQLGPGEALWLSLMHAFDPSAVGGSDGWRYRGIMLVVGVGGLFILSALIGVLTTGLDAQLAALRKGRSRVVERGHTVVLGWSANAFTVLEELAVANANQRSSCVVVLANHDKAAMEDSIRERVAMGGTRVVCRTGTALDPADLALVRPERARAIIVLPLECEDADVQTLKILMSIRQARRRGVDCPVVAALRSPAMLDTARALADPATTLVLVDDFLARMTAQTCRQRGLSLVYQELLDFAGDEIYLIPSGPAAGMTIRDAMHACSGGTVIGLRSPDGRTLLAPPPDTVIGQDDAVIVIAADDDTAAMTPTEAWPIERAHIRTAPRPSAAPERTLLLGWNGRAPTILRELDAYVAPGSSALVAARSPVNDEVAAVSAGLDRLEVKYQSADVVDPAALKKLNVESFDHVVVLASDQAVDIQAADARTLVTLVNLRALVDEPRVDPATDSTRATMGTTPSAVSSREISIVSEMIDVRNRDLADVAKADDFIVSDRLVSLLLAQIAEKPALASVFTELLDDSGAEVYLRPASDYVTLSEPVTFHTVMAAASERNEIAFGVAQENSITLNPAKNSRMNLDALDRVVVIASS